MRSEDYLAHYGVKGMKWGVRKAKSAAKRVSSAARANPRKAALVGVGGVAAGVGGVYTGKQVSKNRKAERRRQSKIKKMTDKELKRKIERLELEGRYDRLTRKQESNAKRFAEDFVTKNFDRIAGGVTTVIGAEAVRRLLREPGGAKKASSAATKKTAQQARRMASAGTKKSRKVYKVVRTVR